MVGRLLTIGLLVLAGQARGQESIQTDRAALEAIYHATGGDDWTENDNWLGDAPLGHWHGVETNEQGRVTGLRLGGWDENLRTHVGNGLAGTLPPELGTLSHLRWLEIGGNSRLTGPIPAEMGNLSNLESLDLQINGLTGPIPAALGQLNDLRVLWLNNNVLTGSIPAELGNLVGLHDLSLAGNWLTGPVPPELGGLASLTTLDLGSTMLSGPLPVSLTRLSALESLNLDGSGLCAPDEPDVQGWLTTISDFKGVVCVGSVTFSRVVTQPGLGLFDSVVAVADLDGDGRDDILAANFHALDYNVAEPAERWTTRPLRVLVNVGDGSFRHAPELVEGTIDVRRPIVVADDFNGDGRVDLAVFDAGVYVADNPCHDDETRICSSGFGNPPQLFLSRADGVLRSSSALADAVRREHARRPQPHYSRPADLHLKSATSGDIDGDGDVDLWVDSIGGANVSSHFLVNNGDGTFTVDEERAPTELRFSPDSPGSWWYHLQGHLADLDRDGDLDLALGQNRDSTTTFSMFSIVLVNDGTGHYLARIELPHPAFNDGFTNVSGQTHFDVDSDGFQDLVLVHTRNDDLPGVLPFTGRYIQFLVNRGGTSFGDETLTWTGDQSATTPQRNADGEPLDNAAGPTMRDVDGDGCADLVMSRGTTAVHAESPLGYLNDGSGRFRAMSPVPFTGSDPDFGRNGMPADVNGDAAIDFVFPRLHWGADGHHGTADDFTALVTLVNTTPPGPLRCRPRVTAVGVLPTRTLHVGAGAVAVVVDVADAFRHAWTYRASSSASGVATVSMSGSQVTVVPAATGVAAITVTATGADNSVATQRFRVTVLAATTFGDRLEPGTPPRAVHFLELRTRVAALREREGMPSLRWTDPVLTVGVTPVRRVHLTELRDALDEAYDAVGKPVPAYTDGIVTAGVTAVKAVHLEELRNAIRALE